MHDIEHLKCRSCFKTTKDSTVSWLDCALKTQLNSQPQQDTHDFRSLGDLKKKEKEKKKHLTLF